MKSRTIILLYIWVACVSGQINGLRDPKPSDIYNQPDYYVYERPCPFAEDIYPCECTYDSEDSAMDLDCSAVESEEQLKQIFKAEFPFKNFRKFNLMNNVNIKVLEAGVFNGISFEIIDIVYNRHLEVIELYAFDSCYETATSMYLVDNRITSFPYDELSQFSKLSIFDITDNRLNIIPAYAFNGLTSLEALYLDGNDANIVGTFQDLPSLQDISLGYNALTSIPANFIKAGSYYLTDIDLSGNSIISVEPGAFDIVYFLEIDMWGNSLSTLEESTWRPYLEAMGRLYAGFNPLICGCDIAWLFREDQLLNQVGNNTVCTGGENLHDLDPSIFDLC